MAGGSGGGGMASVLIVHTDLALVESIIPVGLTIPVGLIIHPGGDLRVPERNTHRFCLTIGSDVGYTGSSQSRKGGFNVSIINASNKAEPEPEYLYPRWSARITVRMSEGELDRIDDFGNITGRDRSNIIRAAVKEYLDDQPLLREKRAKK